MTRGTAYTLFDRLRVVQLRVASLALIVMMVATLLDVFMRYVFNNPIRGTYEFVEAMMALFVFNGMSTAFFLRRNIAIDLIDSVVRRPVVVALIRMSDVLTVVTIALFAYAMIKPALQSYSYGEVKLELQVPIWWFWAVALAGIAGAILCAIGALLAPPPKPRHDTEPI
ncbi:MAG TPA: TRAP transporter small permease [Pseudolabrys sp.]|nr:TRAP transporter small permease [Pseudolabrys sp.]